MDADVGEGDPQISQIRKREVQNSIACQAEIRYLLFICGYLRPSAALIHISSRLSAAFEVSCALFFCLEEEGTPVIIF
jgi:hypothetical protein